MARIEILDSDWSKSKSWILIGQSSYDLPLTLCINLDPAIAVELSRGEPKSEVMEIERRKAKMRETGSQIRYEVSSSFSASQVTSGFSVPQSSGDNGIQIRK